MQTVTPFLWFDTEAEEAAKFYASIFPKSKIGDIERYGEAGKEIHGKEPGSVMSVAFEINGYGETDLSPRPPFHP